MSETIVSVVNLAKIAGNGVCTIAVIDNVHYLNCVDCLLDLVNSEIDGSVKWVESRARRSLHQVDQPHEASYVWDLGHELCQLLQFRQH